jgi:hypothetical protein
MPGKATAFANEVVALVFNATSIANIAQNNATAAAANMRIALHTADPTASGTQTSSEISYTGYVRKDVARTTAGWPAPSGGVISPAANIDFGASTGGTGGTVTHASIGIDTGTAGRILYFGAVSPTIVVANGVTPRLTTATTITET